MIGEHLRVRVHRGCQEIGGSCVEVEVEGFRLVLDVGKGLTVGWNEHVPLPPAPGLATGKDPSLLAVLISHPHLDHYRLLDQVSDRVPVYVGRAAASIVNAARFFSPGGPKIRPAGGERLRRR
jgi:ribonuclease J